MTLQELADVAHQFLTDRNWWQFHNPKNDAFNILVESTELAEHFVDHDITGDANKAGIADEMADVLFGIFNFAHVADINLIHEIELLTNQQFPETISFEKLREHSMRYSQSQGFGKASQSQNVISLVVNAGKLADFFIWCTAEESKVIAKEKKSLVGKRLGLVFIDLIVLAHKAQVDLPKEYVRKMHLNAQKYPISESSAEKYAVVKDKNRKH